jgi:hypothetical protein
MRIKQCDVFFFVVVIMDAQSTSLAYTKSLVYDEGIGYKNIFALSDNDSRSREELVSCLALMGRESFCRKYHETCISAMIGVCC